MLHNAPWYSRVMAGSKLTEHLQELSLSIMKYTDLLNEVEKSCIRQGRSELIILKDVMILVKGSIKQVEDFYDYFNLDFSKFKEHLNEIAARQKFSMCGKSLIAHVYMMLCERVKELKDLMDKVTHLKNQRDTDKKGKKLASSNLKFYICCIQAFLFSKEIPVYDKSALAKLENDKKIENLLDVNVLKKLWSVIYELERFVSDVAEVQVAFMRHSEKVANCSEFTELQYDTIKASISSLKFKKFVDTWVSLDCSSNPKKEDVDIDYIRRATEIISNNMCQECAGQHIQSYRNATDQSCGRKPGPVEATDIPISDKAIEL